MNSLISRMNSVDLSKILLFIKLKIKAKIIKHHQMKCRLLSEKYNLLEKRILNSEINSTWNLLKIPNFNMRIQNVKSVIRNLSMEANIGAQHVILMKYALLVRWKTLIKSIICCYFEMISMLFWKLKGAMNLHLTSLQNI